LVLGARNKAQGGDARDGPWRDWPLIGCKPAQVVALPEMGNATTYYSCAVSVISGGWDRTTDTRLMKEDARGSKAEQVRGCGDDAGACPVLVQQGQKAGAGADPDLARVVEAWPSLPRHMKAAVLALVATAR
jgi:hypothetical protein